ncbi:MAG TPA: hypothetical protein VHD69_02315 [Candidatus Paceibacterota bacterium]|jgi:hypothetical protein|nr:hypothetical protein [Candidatus Paceibacterota bacterium]
MRIKSITYAAFLAVCAVCAGFGSPERASASSVAVYIPEKYTEVHAGERMYFQIEALFPENPYRQDFQISYRVLEGSRIIADAEFVKAIETQASFVDFVIIPEEAEEGRHTIEVWISSAGENPAKASASFMVDTDFDWIAVYAGIILAAVLAVGASLWFEIKNIKRRL